MFEQQSEQIQPYAAAIRKLLLGVIYHDDAVWSQLRDYELPIREYLAQIGLSIHLDEIGNFAYLEDSSRDDTKTALPALTTRRPLSFSDTLLLVLLRERLDEHEMRDVDGMPLILTLDEMSDMMKIFLGDYTDARKVEHDTERSINRLMRYGFLTQLKSGSYQVRPVLRSKIDADELDGIKSRLEAYNRINNEMSDNHDESI
jgi:Domain of unknown function (DUF4194)